LRFANQLRSLPADTWTPTPLWVAECGCCYYDREIADLLEFELAATEEQGGRWKHLRTLPTQRSAYALAFGAIDVRMTAMSSLWKIDAQHEATRHDAHTTRTRDRRAQPFAFVSGRVLPCS